MANQHPTRRSVLAAALAFGMVAPLASSVARANAPAAVDAHVMASLDKALAFLKSQQKPDGGWQGEKDPPAITALVLKTFAQDPKTGPSADFVKKGYAKLISYQLDNGGIYQDVLANYNTSIALSALAASNDPALKPHVEKALGYLKGLQFTDKTPADPKGTKVAGPDHVWFGGFGYGRHGRPDMSNAQMAIEALQNAGLSKDDPAFQNALKFITRSQNLSEKNDQKFAGDDGGFVYSPHNDGESQAGVIMGPDGKRIVRSYGSMTYAGLKSMIYAGLTKDDPRVKAAWAWIGKNWTLNANPGMQANDPKLGDMTRYGLYYYYNTMARALNVYDEPVITDAKGAKHDWRKELTDKLVSLQNPDGSWAGEKKWFEDNPVLATAYVALALQEIQKDLKEHPAK
ncbi:MAG TPA: prenyltransferase/squalene oxidase repeat-containing protein [Tepidisphaeraceae bacterium]|nr:prenyltransferase/squalene oxidase repeat-containing protein [Tepidisphaeraceae bacterium]